VGRTAEESASEAEEGERGNVHELALLDEARGCAVIPVAPEGFGIIANVAGRELVVEYTGRDGGFGHT
jgi:hypothetical protein